MPLKKSLRDITIQELEDILNCLEKKFNQRKEEFAKFLPEITPIFDRVYPKRKKEAAKTENKKQEETGRATEFSLVDEYLTEKEREVRYGNAIKTIKKFRETGDLTFEEIKKCLVNAALANFKKRANPDDLQWIIRMVNRLIGVPLSEETEKVVEFSYGTPTKKYDLTERVSIYLNRDFSLAKIEIKAGKNKP
ncbi:MAG: hypothetical protein AB1523_11955 [Bacillota bacterium]